MQKEERKGQPPEKENPPSNLPLPSSELAEEAGEGGEQHGSPRHPAEIPGVSQVRSREEREISLLHRQSNFSCCTQQVCKLEPFGSSQYPLHLKMAIFIPRLPIGLLFHRLLHFVGNAREMDETFCDLSHILKLKASGKKKKKKERIQHEGMALASDSFGCSEKKF